MGFKILDRGKNIEKRPKKSIEEIRKDIVSDDNSIKVVNRGGMTYITIYRNFIKVAILEPDEILMQLSEDGIKDKIKDEVLKGTFDYQLIEEYKNINKESARRRARSKQSNIEKN